MSGRNLCFRAVDRCKSCWFLFSRRLVTPEKVGFNSACSFLRILLHFREAVSAAIGQHGQCILHACNICMVKQALWQE